MVVGILRLTLLIGGARSLKDKRQVVRKVLDRTRARFNVACSEVGDNELWQRAQLGFVAVANDHAFVSEVLEKVTRDVESLAVAEIANRELEIETYGSMRTAPERMPGVKPVLDGPEFDAQDDEKA